MDLNLTGKKALVVGGSKGIGKAICKSLLEEGVDVVICARNVEALEKTKKELESVSENVSIISADISCDVNAGKIIAEVVQKLNGLDIVVNCAGGVDNFGHFEKLSLGDWLQSFNVNLVSIVSVVREAIPFLKKSNQPRVLNISSISGVQPGMFNPHYTAMKAAVINLSKQLANTYARDGILVNVIGVGPVHSEFWDRNVKQYANKNEITIQCARESIEREESLKIPLGRVGDPEDIAGLVCFLASSRANWITGAYFNVAGGKLATIF